jgi:hypothetical protein
MTPLIFSGYVREERPFTAVQTALRRARAVRDELAVLVGEDTASRCIWMCRVGRGAPAKARSLRRPLSELRAQ